MAKVQRRGLQKAPSRDVVDAFMQAPAAAVPYEVEALGVTEPERADERVIARRPGPGRPRSKRRMEPFSSKLEFELRDQLDEYLRENPDVSIVQFLDEAVRMRLAAD
jgi:hypothetical protein